MTSEEHLHEEDEGPEPTDEEWQHIQEQLRQAMRDNGIDLADFDITAAGGANGDEAEGEGEEAEWQDVSGGRLLAVFQCCEAGDHEQLQQLLASSTGQGAGPAAQGQEGTGAAGAAPADSAGAVPAAAASQAAELSGAAGGGAVAAQPQLDVNAPGPDGDTALNLACLYGHGRCVEVLLRYGADPTRVNEQDGSTVLHDAAAGGYLDICSVILAKAPELLAIADEDGDTPLHNAARGNHTEVVQLLLSHGADPRARNAEGHTPAQEADEEPVIELLKKAIMDLLKQAEAAA